MPLAWSRQRRHPRRGRRGPADSAAPRSTSGRSTARCGSHELGLEGDQVADTKHHGGSDQAVYAFAQEDLDLWAERLGEQVRAGHVRREPHHARASTSTRRCSASAGGSARRCCRRARCGSRATTSRAGWAATASTTPAWVQAVRRREPARSLPARRSRRACCRPATRSWSSTGPGTGSRWPRCSGRCTGEPRAAARLLDVPGLPDAGHERGRRRVAPHGRSRH